MKEQKVKKKALKFYHIIFISILLVPFILRNSSKTIKKIIPNVIQRNIDEIFFGRKLNFYSDSIKICNRSSENLTKYFETGDTKYVKLYEFKEDEESKEYIIALIDTLSGEGDTQENFNKYINHLTYIFFFFLVGLVCIPGWVICCSCSCYNCCLCCCLKKPKYLLPFFIVVSIMNSAVIITCMVGLIKAKDIFIGVTNTECSILRFINEVIEGESKITLPKWGGINSIINMFDRTAHEIEEMETDNTKSITEDKKNEYNQEKEEFENAIKDACNAISNEDKYKYNDYILDIAKKFGKFENGNFTENSYADKWSKEAGLTNMIEASYNILGQIVVPNTAIGMRSAIEFIKEMNEGIEAVKDLIGEVVLEYSEQIDYYGKLIFLIIFATLLFISLLIEILLAFFIFFPDRKITNCLKAFIFKYAIHILWNIFALLMIAAFIFGALLTLVGALGEDLFKMFSFLISNKNLSSNSPKIIEGGKGTIILNSCINGNGIISDELGIESDLGNIDILKTLTIEIDKIIGKIIENQSKTDEDLVYDELIAEINLKNAQKNYELVKESSDEKINLKQTISDLNKKLGTCSINERWSFSCSTEYSNLEVDTCSSSSSDTNKCMDPLTCNNELLNRYSDPCQDANELGNIINKLTSAINCIEDNSQSSSIKKQAESIKEQYRIFLNNAKNSLEGYTTKFTPITAIYNNFVGNGSILGFINCAFLGKNVKVMLNYLDDSIGTQFKNLGICVLFIGIEMAFSISFTILLVVIKNETEKIREKEEMIRIMAMENGQFPMTNQQVQNRIFLPPIDKNQIQNNENNVYPVIPQ